MYINLSSPIFSLRTATFKNKNILLIANGNLKTGHNNTNEIPYDTLENFAKKYYKNCNILYKQSSEDCVSLDKLPYIGTYSNLLPNVYVATGFKKWGMTLSNVATNIIVDTICEKENPYSYLFNSKRFDLLKNNELSIESIPENSGGIIKIKDKKVGIYKDKNKIYAINPICTHLGCLLSWNDLDKTWDCPCHGSRYNFKGESLYDPAFKNLESLNYLL